MGDLYKSLFHVGCLFLLCVAFAEGTGEQPDQGFFLASSPPSVNRRQKAYVYAIQTDVIFNDGEVEITKDDEVPSFFSNAGPINGDGRQWGCYAEIGVPNSYTGSRFGQYDGKFTPSNTATFDIVTGHTFVRPRSRFLNTGGVFTVAVYPSSVGSTTLDEQTIIGVNFAPGCRRIRWCKGNQRNFHTGQQLKLTSTEDGGVYTLQRPRRGIRGWFVQIEVKVASCPRGMYSNSGTCTTGVVCQNGGILRDKANDCICPPFQGRFNCRCNIETTESGNPFVLGDTRTQGNHELICSDLPGGNKNCRGLLVCFGDLYGCKCSPGWRGSRCDRPCPRGRWGPDCTLKCPSTEPDCSRFFGPSENRFDVCS